MHKLFVFMFLLLFIGGNIVLGQISTVRTTPAAVPTFWWRCSDGDSLLNYNNATIIGNGDSLVFDSLPYAKDYTMVVVYKALDNNEANVWRMDFLDSVTLGPVDYLDGDGNKIWEYVDSGRYHHRVTGVGRDSTYSLYQLSSRSEMDGSLLTIETDSLSEHAFLTVGDNDEPLVFVEGDDGVEILARQWKARAVNVDNNAFSLVFDIRNMPMPTDSIALLLDGNVILPTVAIMRSFS